MTKQAKIITVSYGRLKRLGKDIYGEYQAYDRWADWEDDDDGFFSAHMVAEDIGGFWEAFTKLAPELAEEIEGEGKK